MVLQPISFLILICGAFSGLASSEAATQLEGSVVILSVFCPSVDAGPLAPQFSTSVCDASMALLMCLFQNLMAIGRSSMAVSASTL
jgi:hypothetical protein